MLSDRWTVSALLGGTATAVLVFLLVGSRPTGVSDSTGQGPADSGPVVLATGFVPAGTELSQDRMVLHMVSRDAIPAGAATAPDQLLGKRALVPLYRGEAIMKARVGDGGVSGDSLVLPGRTIFALPLDPSHAVGGVITGGDMIAIIGATSSKQGEPPTILMDNIAVLGVAGEFPFGGTPPITGSSSSRDAGTAPGGAFGPSVGGRDGHRIALVDLTLDQAQVLARAIDNGHLFVALKSRVNEKRSVSSTRVDGGDR